MKRYKYRKRFTYRGHQYNVLADDLVELGRKYAEKLAELESGAVVINGNTTLNEWAPKCIDTYKTGQKPVTKKKYMNRVKCCILSEIGYESIADITPMELQQVLNKQEGKSKTQINEVYQALRFLFRHAVENHLRTDDPTLFLSKPSGTHTGRRALTPTEREVSSIVVGRLSLRVSLTVSLSHLPTGTTPILQRL